MYYERVVPAHLKIFLNNPSKESFKQLWQSNTGETDYLDFKMMWIEWTKMAKHILAIANSGGGCIIIGVRQNDLGSIDWVGLKEESFLDKADVDNKLHHLLPKYLKYRTEDFIFSKDEHADLRFKRFQVLIIEYDPKYVPYTSIVNRGELRYGSIYIRQGTKTMEASNDKLVEIILRKVQSGGSDSDEISLQDHFRQLKGLFLEFQSLEKSPYKDYIGELINRKKTRIEGYLNLDSKE
ncbi:putative HTH transcriptional regulator [Bacillus pakistanensis]|uniref:HTH transcriptional regulator n=1 Tax=Rossellomorea pakistanensis TaxID=992288 RepID=A0ABS2N8N2_9BACI|nr:ATP-binding protein [Bacillus pakistanensis]MBM7584217.1 putative HTH transcriptional regulator [Bacillus pakistanensis]